MIILGSNATITGEVEMLSNTAFNGGRRRGNQGGVLGFHNPHGRGKVLMD